MKKRHGFTTLTARFDSAALRAFAWPPQSDHAWLALRSWCLRDLTSLPLAVAVHAVTAGSRAPDRVAALALDLDGSGLLMRCAGTFARWRLKLRVKLQDAFGVWPREDGGIWDSGFVAPDTAAWQALERFDPRRPTFIVMQGLPPAQVERLLQALRARSAGFSRPVRVLVLLEPGSAAPAAADHIPA